MTDRLSAVLAAIDAANATDPTSQRDGDTDYPAALLYGKRMSAELERTCTEPSELVQIAARGQHIERWKLSRSVFPEGREGYLEWRKAQAARHARRISGLMAEAGYSHADQEQVAGMLRKTNLKRDPEVQLLEDVACFVFLRWYFTDFTARRAPDQVLRIVAKTARKMSSKARARAAVEFDLPADLAKALTG